VFLSRVITGVESWLYSYDPETEQQFSQWKIPNSPRPKMIRQVKNRVKWMLIIFFDVKGIVHKEFVQAGQTVNFACFSDVLQRLHENVWRLRLELRQQKNWLLHHDIHHLTLPFSPGNF
jgi:hypothetical protein